METLFARSARTIPLTKRQREMVVGSLLGDGYLMATTAGWCFRASHGLQQLAYVDWKHEMLAGLVSTPPRICGKSYYFRTVTHPEFSELRWVFYGDTTRKGVPFEFLSKELTPLGLAAWFMDDGASDRKQLRINTQGFSSRENLEMIPFLQASFGIHVTLNKDKDRYRLRIAAASIDRFRSLVEPFVIPSMLYKLAPVTTSRSRER